MATTIQSASSLFEGDSSAELVTVATGAATRTTVNGDAGSDTISIISGNSVVTATVLKGQGGADVITLSGAQLNSSQVLGGAGADSITIRDNDADVGEQNSTEFKLGDGSDEFIISGSNLSGGSNILGGSGADLIQVLVTEQTGNSIGGGSGIDTISIDGTVNSLAASAITVLGGGGNDFITISGNIGSNTEINGDSSVNGGGLDTITIVGDASNGSTVQGKGGADEILISGVAASARVNGGAGADTIFIGKGVAQSANILGADGADLITIGNSGFGGDQAFVGGGSGEDTITYVGSGAVQNASSNTVNGGGGSDFISFNTEISNTGLGAYGGAGADTIEVGGAFTGGVVGAASTGYIGYEALSDSSVDAIDKISGTNAVSGYNFIFDTAAGVTSFTIGAYSDSDASTPSITAGVVSGATFSSADSTVTSRATDIDALVSTKGTLVSFDANGENYIFIQGGESGVADDAIIEVNRDVTGFTVGTDYTFFADMGDGQV